MSTLPGSERACSLPVKIIALEEDVRFEERLASNPAQWGFVGAFRLRAVVGRSSPALEEDSSILFAADPSLPMVGMEK